MPDIVALMLPILILIVLGFLAVRFGLATGAHIEGLAAFVLNFALPAVLLSALSRQDLTQSFNLSYVLAYAAGSLVAFTAVLAILRKIMGRPLAPAVMGGLGAAASNTGFIGFPIASLAFGDLALTAVPLTMLVENIIVLPLAFALVEWGSSSEASVGAILRQTARRLSRMPLLIAIVLGVLLALLGLHLPAPVVKSIDMLATASAPCALFVVGGTIATLRKADLASDIPVIIAGKLLLHPLAVTAALFLIPGVSRELTAVGIVLASVSMITVYPILSRRTGTDSVAAATLIIATALALVTISITLLLVAPLTAGV